MKTTLIGRKTEIKLLNDSFISGKAELVAVYGRRRVGKTYLIKSLYMDLFDFYVTGIYEGTKKEELSHFHSRLVEYSGIPYPVPSSWSEAFAQLRHYLEQLKKDRIVLFIDEMPWLDTPRSQFIKAFGSFWNEWASTQASIFLIVCGSATTWMQDHVLREKGGLHNRVTRKIKLSQFTLGGDRAFLTIQRDSMASASDHRMLDDLWRNPLLSGPPSDRVEFVSER